MHLEQQRLINFSIELVLGLKQNTAAKTLNWDGASCCTILSNLVGLTSECWSVTNI